MWRLAMRPISNFLIPKCARAASDRSIYPIRAEKGAGALASERGREVAFLLRSRRSQFRPPPLRGILPPFHYPKVLYEI
jgi:hypothetical protein